MTRHPHRVAFVRAIRQSLLERVEALLAGDVALGDPALADLNHALDLIDQGSYGICEACGRGLPNERLIEQPLLTRCASCLRVTEAN